MCYNVHEIYGKEKVAMSKVMKKFGGMFAALALVITTFTVNSACAFLMHQPMLPEEARKLRKF